MDTLVSMYVSGGTLSTVLLGIGIVLWIYAILWVAKDISRRTESFGLQLISILMVVFLTPLVGLPLYFLVRPVYAEASVQTIDDGVACFSCKGSNDKDFIYCVYCGETLKIACPSCEQPVGVDYTFCAWCGEAINPPEM